MVYNWLFPQIFCHFYSDCRVRARRELDSCADGPVSALMAKSEGPFKKSEETEEKDNQRDEMRQKCQKGTENQENSNFFFKCANRKRYHQ